jgi:putative transposase
VKYGFIARHRSVWPTRTMCRIMAVSHSGFYEWLDRGATPKKNPLERD